MKFLKNPATVAGLALATSLAMTSFSYADGHLKSEMNTMYVSAFGGVIFSGESDTDGIVGGLPNSVFAELGTGYIFGAAFGSSLGEFGNESVTPRVELELSYSNADVDRVEFTGNAVSPEINVAGDISSTLILANAYLDFNTDTAFTPFFGAGAGLGIVNFDFAYGGAARPGLRESDSGFAAQAIVGFSYDLTENVKWVVDGRYSRIFDVESRRTLINGVNTGTVSGNVDNFAFTTGLRFSF